MEEKKCLGLLYLVYKHKHLYKYCSVLENALLSTSKELEDENILMSEQRQSLMVSYRMSPSSGQLMLLHNSPVCVPVFKLPEELTHSLILYSPAFSSRGTIWLSDMCFHILT